jgi:hypothetical protein
VPVVQLSCPEQVTSHAHDTLQSTPRHEPPPKQLTSHVPRPQATLRHEPAPEHVMLHDVPAVQSTPLRHESPTSHRMLQFQPVGHVTALLQSAPLLQSMVQVIVLGTQLVHCDGHTSASTWIAPSPGGASASPVTTQ